MTAKLLALAASARPRGLPGTARPDHGLRALIEEAWKRAHRRRKRVRLVGVALVVLAGTTTLVISGRDGVTDNPRVAQAPGLATPLPDGRYFGLVRAASNGRITFDRRLFLTGAAAERAARAAGALAPEEALSNDYFIADDNAGDYTVRASGRTTVAVVRCPNSCREGFSTTLEDLPGELRNQHTDDSYNGSSLFWITVSHGEVTRLREQYVP